MVFGDSKRPAIILPNHDGNQPFTVPYVGFYGEFEGKTRAMWFGFRLYFLWAKIQAETSEAQPGPRCRNRYLGCWNFGVKVKGVKKLVFRSNNW